MVKTKGKIRIGTSGWQYDDWKGRFYPAKLKKSEWLGFYMGHFDTVEINNTFYNLPKESTFENWHERAKKGFVYTIKANRYITHIKKLKDPADALSNFLERAELLGDNLGPILYQLPPNLHINVEKLSNFISMLPKEHLSVFEFRHESWYCDEIYELLDENGIGFCTHDMQDSVSPKMVTGKLLYLRLHGAGGRYRGNYPAQTLGKWARWIKENAGGRDVYVYFNNDIDGHAVENAKQLRDMLAGK